MKCGNIYIKKKPEEKYNCLASILHELLHYEVPSICSLQFMPHLEAGIKKKCCKKNEFPSVEEVDGNKICVNLFTN